MILLIPFLAYAVALFWTASRETGVCKEALISAGMFLILVSVNRWLLNVGFIDTVTVQFLNNIAATVATVGILSSLVAEKIARRNHAID